jgi:hypothetical protein
MQHISQILENLFMPTTPEEIKMHDIARVLAATNLNADQQFILAKYGQLLQPMDAAARDLILSLVEANMSQQNQIAALIKEILR